MPMMTGANPVPVTDQTREVKHRGWAWLFLVVPLLLFVPVIPGGATYEGVGPARDLKVHRSAKSGKFILENGKLYLLRHQVYHAVIITTYIREIRWSPTDLQQLRRHFPELNNDTFWQMSYGETEAEMETR
jgi:hypothetical protein